MKGDLLQVDIRDNGIGREKAARLKKDRRPGHQSVALKVNQERLEALRVNSNYTPLLITDILDEAAKVSGTQVRVIIPVEYAY